MKRSALYVPLLGFSLLSLAGASVAGDLEEGWDYKTLPGAACPNPPRPSTQPTSCAPRSVS